MGCCLPGETSGGKFWRKLATLLKRFVPCSLEKIPAPEKEVGEVGELGMRMATARLGARKAALLILY